MKKIIIIASVIFSQFTFAQNNGNNNGGGTTTITETTSGNIGIGTTTPSAKLDVNGTLIVDEEAIFKKNTNTNGNASVEGNIKGDQNLTIDGTAKFNGVVKMPNIGTPNNGILNSQNYEILIKLPNGNVKTVSTQDIANMAYGKYIDCFGVTQVSNPTWSHGTNKIYTSVCNLVNVGIGTSAPDYKLDVKGTTYSIKLKIGSKYAQANALINGFSFENTQDIVNFGVRNSQTGNQSQVLFKITNNGAVIIKTRNQSNPLTVYSTAGSKILQLNDSGLLRAREIKVDLATWPDYVFNTNYKLMSLKNVAKYIKMYNHLPGVPTAKEIETKGLGLGKMQTIQMEKIEELTLYTIQQDQKINKLENTVEDLRQQINDIKAMLK